MKFGLLGARLGHSLSPQIHREVFRQLGIDATYELIEVPAEKLADMLEPGDIVLLKGSHSMQVAGIIDLVFKK